MVNMVKIEEPTKKCRRFQPKGTAPNFDISPMAPMDFVRLSPMTVNIVSLADDPVEA